jgi:hypothetical protein
VQVPEAIFSLTALFVSSFYFIESIQGLNFPDIVNRYTYLSKKRDRFSPVKLGILKISLPG